MGVTITTPLSSSRPHTASAAKKSRLPSLPLAREARRCTVCVRVCVTMCGVGAKCAASIFGEYTVVKSLASRLRLFFASFFISFVDARSALLSCFSSLFSTSTSPTGIFAGQLVPAIESPSEVPMLRSGTRFKETTKRGMEYSKHIIAETIFRVPKTAHKSVPDMWLQLQDALPVALVLFIEIIRKFYSHNLDEWDHDRLESRVAASVASGIAMKLVMDVCPVGTMHCLCGLVHQKELGMDYLQIMDFVVGFEVTVLQNISVMACINNHHALAHAFLLRVHLDETLVRRAQQVCIFFSFNAMQWMESYMNEFGGDAVGHALGLLALKCADFPRFTVTYQTVLAPAKVYQLSFRMADHIETLSQSTAQNPLRGNFVDSAAWEHMATKSRSVTVIKYSVAGDRSVLFPNRKQ